MNESRLFVGNLPFRATDNELMDHFGQAGTVISVQVVFDKGTGRSRGFGFVEMSSPEEALKAVELFHEKDFQGRNLAVNVARPRLDRRP